MPGCAAVVRFVGGAVLGPELSSTDKRRANTHILHTTLLLLLTAGVWTQVYRRRTVAQKWSGVGPNHEKTTDKEKRSLK